MQELLILAVFSWFIGLPVPVSVPEIEVVECIPVSPDKRDADWTVTVGDIAAAVITTNSKRHFILHNKVSYHKYIARHYSSRRRRILFTITDST